MTDPIYHLLIPKQHEVWCHKGRPPGDSMNVTNLPSKATCCNCLSALRYEKRRGGGTPRGSGSFKIKWTARNQDSGAYPEPDADECRECGRTRCKCLK